MKPPARLAAPVCCEGCGTPDWWRCAPGTAADASPFLPHVMTNVAVLPHVAVRSVAWCLDCDPWLKRQVAP